jgi:hypothetical protein
MTDIYCIYHEIGDGGVIRFQGIYALDRAKAEAITLSEMYPDSYIELYRNKDHRIFFRHDPALSEAERKRLGIHA